MEIFLKEVNVSMNNIKQLIILTIILIISDVITGIINAILGKELNSTKMKTGIIGKFYELLLITLTIVMDNILPIKEIHLPAIVCIFYIAQEGLSIIENTGRYINYPHVIKDIFIKLQDISNKGDNNEDKK